MTLSLIVPHSPLAIPSGSPLSGAVPALFGSSSTRMTRWAFSDTTGQSLSVTTVAPPSVSSLILTGWFSQESASSDDVQIEFSGRSTGGWSSLAEDSLLGTELDVAVPAAFILYSGALSGLSWVANSVCELAFGRVTGDSTSDLNLHAFTLDWT